MGGKKRTLKFAIPRIWWELTGHSSKCYFCMVGLSKCQTGKHAPPIMYPDIPSSITLVPLCPDLPIPTPPEKDQQGRYYRSRLQFHRCGWREKAILPPTIKTLMIWSETDQVQCWSDIKAQQVELVRWKCASHRSEKASQNIFPLSSVSKMGSASATMWPVYLRLYRSDLWPMWMVLIHRWFIQEPQNCTAS